MTNGVARAPELSALGLSCAAFRFRAVPLISPPSAAPPAAAVFRMKFQVSHLLLPTYRHVYHTNTHGLAWFSGKDLLSLLRRVRLVFISVLNHLVLKTTPGRCLWDLLLGETLDKLAHPWRKRLQIKPRPGSCRMVLEVLTRSAAPGHCWSSHLPEVSTAMLNSVRHPTPPASPQPTMLQVTRGRSSRSLESQHLTQ